MNIGVAYLAWHALDPMVFQRFAESYRRHAAGCEHDLIVIYAGFDQPRTLQDAYAAFRTYRISRSRCQTHGKTSPTTWKQRGVLRINTCVF